MSQRVPRVLAHGREKGVAGFAIAYLEACRGPGHQAAQEIELVAPCKLRDGQSCAWAVCTNVQCLRAGQPVVGADGFGGIEGPATGEHGQASKQHPFRAG